MNPTYDSSDATAHAAPADPAGAAPIGAFLFRNRSWLSVPLVLLLVLVPGNQTPGHWLAGALLIALGEALRLAGVAAAGTVTRRRSRDVQRLVTYGIFGWTRNPLYIGNFFIWIGFATVAGVDWIIPVAAALYAVEYGLIVRYEEDVLTSIFGDEYLAYKSRTPRWIPRPPVESASGPHDWGEAWRSETSTFIQYAVLGAVFWIKDRVA